MSEVKYTNYQKRSIDRIYNMFNESSRVFLADEAGLGKTVTAAGVMDKLYEKEYKNSSEVMYVLYVAPSDFIARDASEKLVSKSKNESQIKIYEKKKNIPFRLTDLLNDKYELKTVDEGKKIVVFPISIEQLEGTIGSQREKKIVVDYYQKQGEIDELEAYFKVNCIKKFFNKTKEIFENKTKKNGQKIESVSKIEKICDQIKEELEDLALNVKLEYINMLWGGFNHLKETKGEIEKELEKKSNDNLNPQKPDLNSLIKKELESLNAHLEYIDKLYASRPNHLGEIEEKEKSNDNLNLQKTGLEIRTQKKLENLNAYLKYINTLCQGRIKHLNETRERELEKKSNDDPNQKESGLDLLIKKELENIDINYATSCKNFFNSKDINRSKLEYDIFCKLKPRLIIWDEFHRYAEAFLEKKGKETCKKDSSFSIYETEIKNSNKENAKMNMLFLSATPYESNIGGANKRQYELGYKDEVQDKPLPSFKEFAVLSESKELIKLSKSYTEALADFINNGDLEKLENLKSRKEEVEVELRKIMIRHERTQMNEYNKEKFEELFNVDNIYDEDNDNKLTEEYEEVFRESWKYHQAMLNHNILARKWAMQMPYIYSFSKLSGGEGTKNYRALNGSVKIEDSLYLSNDSNLFLDQIKKIDKNTLQFHEIIKHSISDDRDLLLWVPPAVRKYDLHEESIFLKHKNHSKLLVFAEFICYQRGIPFLLSEYVDREESKEKDIIRFEEYTEKKVEEIVKIDVFNLGNTLEEIMNKLPSEWSDKKKYAAIGDPAVCVYRLKNNHEIAKKARALFEEYFNNQSIKNVLNRWKQKYAPECDLIEAALKYCCEGNLYSVLEEWLMHDENIFGKMEDILTKTIIINPIRRSKNQELEYDYKKECKFAFRLSADVKDNKSSGTNVKKDHKSELVKCFSSPFWPMVMVTGKGAQESMDFHTYCRRIMHFTIPKGAVSVEQREGRINRYDSLLVKSRAALLKTNDDTSVKGILKRLEEESNKGDLYPHWMLPDKEQKIKFQRILAFWPYTDEANEWSRDCTMLNTYRAVFGSIESHQKIVEKLQELDCEDVFEDIIINLSADK